MTKFEILQNITWALCMGGLLVFIVWCFDWLLRDKHNRFRGSHLSQFKDWKGSRFNRHQDR